MIDWMYRNSEYLMPSVLLPLMGILVFLGYFTLRSFRTTPWLATFIPATTVVIAVGAMGLRVLSNVLHEFAQGASVGCYSGFDHLPQIAILTLVPALLLSLILLTNGCRTKGVTRWAAWFLVLITTAVGGACFGLYGYIPQSYPFRGCPDFGCGPNRTAGVYDPAQMAEWANRYIVMGEVTAFQELTQKPWLCRYLDWYGPPYLLSAAVYGGSIAKPLRPQRFGSVRWDPFQRADTNDWPNLPLIVSEDVLFLAPVSGGFLAGVAELPGDYLKYSKANGVFRHTRYKVPTRKQANEALDTLFSSERWRKLQWQGLGWANPDSYVREWLREQAAAIK